MSGEGNNIHLTDLRRHANLVWRFYSVMNMKEHILTALMEEFNHWEDLLRTMGKEQVLVPLAPSEWSTKDVVAHLMAWQKRSIARMEAASESRLPDFPEWIPELDPDEDENTEVTNAWIYNTYREKPWAAVYKQWRDGFLHFVDLGDAMPEQHLLDAGKYVWLKGEPLALILLSSYDHHQEHLDSVTAWQKLHVKS